MEPSGKGVRWDSVPKMSLDDSGFGPTPRQERKLERKLSLADGVSSEELLARLNKKDIDSSTRWQDAVHIADESRIHRDIQHLSGMAYRVQRNLALICVFHASLSVWINELCSGREYVAEEERIYLVLLEECQYSYAEYLKVFQIFVTLFLLRQLLQLTRRALSIKQLEQELIERRRSKYASGPLHRVTMWTPEIMCKFLLEFILCVPTNIPFVHGRVAVSMRDMEVSYRLEAIVCAVTFLRLYHIWRWLHSQVYFRFFNLEESYLLQDKETITQLEDSGTSYKFLALKVAISRQPLRVIGVFAVTLISVVSYLIRLAEGPAGQDHSGPMLDQVWFVIVSLTTTGYGDIVPSTDVGRVAAVFVMAIGPVVTAFITATTTRSLSLTGDEQQMVRKLDGNKIKLQVVENATLLIQLWWKEHSASSTSGVLHSHDRSHRWFPRGSDANAVHNFDSRRSAGSAFNSTLKVLVGHEGYAQRNVELWKKFYASVAALRQYERSHRGGGLKFCADDHDAPAAGTAFSRTASVERGGTSAKGVSRNPSTDGARNPAVSRQSSLAAGNISSIDGGRGADRGEGTPLSVGGDQEAVSDCSRAGSARGLPLRSSAPARSASGAAMTPVGGVYRTRSTASTPLPGPVVEEGGGCADEVEGVKREVAGVHRRLQSLEDSVEQIKSMLLRMEARAEGRPLIPMPTPTTRRSGKDSLAEWRQVDELQRSSSDENPGKPGPTPSATSRSRSPRGRFGDKRKPRSSNERDTARVRMDGQVAGAAESGNSLRMEAADIASCRESEQQRPREDAIGLDEGLDTPQTTDTSDVDHRLSPMARQSMIEGGPDSDSPLPGQPQLSPHLDETERMRPPRSVGKTEAAAMAMGMGTLIVESSADDGRISSSKPAQHAEP